MVRRGMNWRQMTRRLLRRLFSRENMLALALCLIVLLLIIVTTSAAPQWIYQGF